MQKLKDFLKQLSKLTKISFIILLILTIIINIFNIIFANLDLLNVGESNMSYKTSNNLTYMMMKKTIHDEELGIDFHVKKNPDYDQENDEIVNAFLYYYESDAGEEIYLKDGVYMTIKDSEKDKSISIWFFLSAGNNLVKMIKVFKIVGIVLAVLLFLFIIGLWYKSFSLQEDEADENLYGEKATKKKYKFKKKK